MYRVLLVDDEQMICKGLEKFVEWEQLGFEIAGEAQNVSDAVALFENSPFDLVITDIRMPEESGLSLLAKLRETHNSFLSVVLSGYDEFSYAQKAIELGVSYYLLKPLQYEEFYDVVCKVKKELDLRRRLCFVPSPSLQSTFYYDGINGQTVSAVEEGKLLCNEQEISSIYSDLAAGNREKVWDAADKLIDRMLAARLEPNAFAKQVAQLAAKLEEMFELYKGQPVVWENKISEDIFTRCNTARACVDTFYDFLGQMWEIHLQSVEGSSMMGRMTEYIYRNVDKDITLEVLADKFSLNPNYICQLFRKKLHITFLEFLTNARIEVAKRYLKDVTLKTYEVADLSGFRDARYFSQVFKRYTGFTPSEYREQMIGKR